MKRNVTSVRPDATPPDTLQHHSCGGIVRGSKSQWIWTQPTIKPDMLILNPERAPTARAPALCSSIPHHDVQSPLSLSLHCPVPEAINTLFQKKTMCCINCKALHGNNFGIS